MKTMTIQRISLNKVFVSIAYKIFRIHLVFRDLHSFFIQKRILLPESLLKNSEKDVVSEQATVYGEKFLMKYYFNLTPDCHYVLISENIKSQHLLTMFKENDDKRHLTYDIKNVTSI